jgi:CubicO group peptidase (beta-lactamase class C family)
MTSTFAGNSSGRERVARGHMNGTPVASFELDIVNMGAGDLWSTAGDIGRWDSALAAGSILSEVSRRAMLQDQAGSSLDIGAGTDTDDKDSPITVDGYGYGWFIGTALGRRVIFHPGDNAGFGSLNAWFPDEDLRVIVLSNEEATDVEGVAVELLTSLTA